jgi:hypothetical protein
MGNWGNTLDRWYRRAAVVVWPREQAFANHAETSPAWALDELAGMASSGGQPDALAAAATLAPFWDSALRARAPGQTGGIPGLFGKALRAAGAVADAETAAMLLRPFCVEDLTGAYVGPFGNIVSDYGEQWTADLLRTWSGGRQQAWAYGGGQEWRQWVADQLPGLCAGLHAAHSVGEVAAQRLLGLAWEWIVLGVGTALTSPTPSYRDRELTDLGKPLASLLTAAAAIGAASTRDTVSGDIRQQGDAVTALEMSALRAGAELHRDGAPADTGFDRLAADCAARLRTRLAHPQRAPGDWSIRLPAGGCTCDLCDTLF